jgi:hypothetical protein
MHQHFRPIVINILARLDGNGHGAPLDHAGEAVVVAVAPEG